MKNTPNVNGQTSSNGAKNNSPFTITPAEAVPVSKLIEQAKLQNPDAIKQPTTYSQPAKTEPEDTTPAPQTGSAIAPEPTPFVEMPASRSRAEEIDFQVEKAQKLQLINTQLLSLKAKQAELKQFSYAVDKDEDYRYGRIVIYDDANREFICKNHGLAAIVVESLKTLFGEKIEEKENELLTVSKS
jgi:hypothetical protein